MNYPIRDHSSPESGQTAEQLDLLRSECDSQKPQVLAELIVEEVSIDGMCGVY